MLQVRSQIDLDKPTLYALFTTCFSTEKDARLLDSLYNTRFGQVSLVALEDGEIVGHILFTRACIKHANHAYPTMSLAYLLVHPDHRHQGIGTMLIKKGVEQCNYLGYHCIPAFGNLDVFATLGFEAATNFGIRTQSTLAHQNMLIHWSDDTHVKEDCHVQFPVEFLQFSQHLAVL